MWQWNHNPDNNFWSLTDRPGHLRLINGSLSEGLLDARNTLTQRMFGPESSGVVSIDISNMKHGDYAGLAALQKNYGFVGVKMTGTTKSIVMVNGSSGAHVEVESVPLAQNRIYFKVESDFRNQRDQANFYYSLDGHRWTAIGNTLRMSYTLPHFMGYRFALFSFATVSTGGYVDFDYFRISDKMTGTNDNVVVLNAELVQVSNVVGAQNTKIEIPVRMDALPEGTYESIEASFTIPDGLSVDSVEFNSSNVVGKYEFEYSDHQLKLKVFDNVTYTTKQSELFATIILKLTKFVPTNRSFTVSADYIVADEERLFIIAAV